MRRPFFIAILAALTSVALAASSSGQQERAPIAPIVAAYTPPPLPSAAERMRLRDGLAAAENGDWIGLAALRDSASDPLIRRMLSWKLAVSQDAPLSFGEISATLRDLQGWPGRTTMRQRAEQAITDTALPAADRVSFLRTDGGPITGDGRIALAIALKNQDRRREAQEIASAAWRADTFTPEMEARAREEFTFSSEDYADRVDLLLWRGQRSAAQAYLGRLSAADRLLAQGRIALQARVRRGMQAAVDAVPASRADDPGFLYDRTQYRRRTGRPEEALPIAVAIDAREAPMVARDDIYRERRLYVPRALRAGNYRQAYALVSNHGMTSGESFADAEWMSGWLMLRYLNQPQRAAEHFAHLNENVNAPVSRARALYWRAEAARALGQTAEADAFLAEAARLNFTYYGQLAATRGDRSGTLSMPATHDISEEVRDRFESRELVRALRIMAETGSARDYESIAFYLDDTLDDPMEIELLSQMGREQAYTRTALRNAKAGLFRNVVATNAAYPMIELPALIRARGRPEPALVLSIIRQESEFDPSASSHANAHGLMQLIPSTARLQAAREGMTYQRALLTDPQYNMTLGASHLADLIDDFGGSYVLAIAAYNAGPGNVREWIQDWGDPRSRSVDVIDWIELIPFSETRNYVQRVTENLQVYRHRLAGAPTPIELERDLQRGRS